MQECKNAEMQECNSAVFALLHAALIHPPFALRPALFGGLPQAPELDMIVFDG
jgi:hypothetical protein